MGNSGGGGDYTNAHPRTVLGVTLLISTWPRCLILIKQERHPAGIRFNVRSGLFVIKCWQIPGQHNIIIGVPYCHKTANVT